MKSEHLGQQEFAAAACGETRQDVADHLRECPACAARLADDADTLNAFAASVNRAAERPEAEWMRQRNVILSLARSGNRRGAALPWAAATALLVVAALALVLGIPGATPAPTSRRTAANHAASAANADALFTVIAEELDRDAPDALAPAALLVDQPTSPAGSRLRGRTRQGEQND